MAFPVSDLDTTDDPARAETAFAQSHPDAVALMPDIKDLIDDVRGDLGRTLQAGLEGANRNLTARDWNGKAAEAARLHYAALEVDALWKIYKDANPSAQLPFSSFQDFVGEKLLDREFLSNLQVSGINLISETLNARLPLSPDLGDFCAWIKKEVLQPAVQNIEEISDPNDEAVRAFHRRLLHTFKADEVTTLSAFQDKLRMAPENPNCKTVLYVLRNPFTKEIIGAVTGAYFPEINMAAMEYQITAFPFIGMGMGSRLTAEYKTNLARKFGQNPRFIFGESDAGAVKGWLKPAFDGKLLFHPDGKYIQYYQGSYEIDPDTGLPPDVADSNDSENLKSIPLDLFMIPHERGTEEIASEDYLNAVTALYRNWYQRPRDYFNSDDAYQKHLGYIQALIDLAASQVRGVSKFKITGKVQRADETWKPVIPR